MAKSIRHIATVPANLSTRVGGNMESALEVQDASPTSNSDTDISPGRASPSQFSQRSDPSGGSGSRPPINFTLPIMNGPSAVEANKKDTDDTPATMTAAPSASRRRHRRAGDWEIMQGLRSGQKCEERPEKFEGYILKRRKWPLKGWHKRFFCLEKGILIYAKSTTEMAKGKIHGSVDLGLSVISTKTKGRRIDIDAEEFIYHLKVKNQAQFLQWVSQLRHHRLYRQHEIAYGSREAPKITSPVEEIPCGGIESSRPPPLMRENSRLIRSPISQQSRVAAWILDSTAIDNGNKDISVLQEKLFQLANILQMMESTPNAIAANYLEIPDSEHTGQKKDRKRFHLKRSKKPKKEQSDENSKQQVKPGLPPKHLSVEITVSQDPALNSGSMDNLNDVNKEKVESSLPIRDMGYLSCSHPSLSTESANHPHNLPDSASLISYGSYDSGSSTMYKNMEDFVSLSKEVHGGLRLVLRSLQTERERLKQLLENESIPSSNSNAALISSLKNSLSQALQQNSDLRARLQRIHEESDLATLPPPDSPAAESFDEPTLVHQPLQPSLSHESSSVLSTSEFFDAAENLSNTSTSSEASASEDEESFCSEVSDDGTEYTPVPTAADQIPRTQGRRSKLPATKPDTGDLSLWSLLCKNIGKDLSKVSMPVTLNEPLNVLQRLCEELEYSELLDKASETEDHFERMVCVAAFAVSGLSSLYYRAGHKPFNPLLGETYECVREDKGFRFVAEQVSHHPPICACYTEARNFIIWQDVRIKTKFWGKSMEILPIGTVHLSLPNLGCNYQWNKVTTCVHNIFSGQRWVDQYGEMTIKDLTHDVICKLTFVKTSYWSDKRHEVFGTVMNKQGEVIHHLFGQWTEALYCGVAPTAKCIWRPGAMPEEYELYYGFTRFAIELNEQDPETAKLLPPTDTRFRPDQRLLEEGNITAAESTKSQLENAQRERRKSREEKGEEYTPMWFRREILKGGKEDWVFTHKYWEVRQNPGFSNINFPEPLW